jgi:hypothetical protein
MPGICIRRYNGVAQYTHSHQKYLEAVGSRQQHAVKSMVRLVAACNWMDLGDPTAAGAPPRTPALGAMGLETPLAPPLGALGQAFSWDFDVMATTAGQLAKAGHTMRVPPYCLDLAKGLPSQPFFAAGVGSSSSSGSTVALRDALNAAAGLSSQVSELRQIVRSLPEVFKKAGIVQAADAASANTGSNTLRTMLTAAAQVSIGSSVWVVPLHPPTHSVAMSVVMLTGAAAFGTAPAMCACHDVLSTAAAE